VLGNDWFISFSKAINSERDQKITAVKLMNEAIIRGEDIESIFFTDDESGFSLLIQPLEKNSSKVEFGCAAGPLAGDGGEWIVRFEPDGRVAGVKIGIEWMALTQHRRGKNGVKNIPYIGSMNLGW
jgi:hypothetical protein